MPAFMIAAAHKSSGKTLVSTGLTAALQARGQKVYSFKKGPDYIDPMWLSAASGRPCYNLDFNTMDTAELVDFFASRSIGASVILVEANKGLYDGVDPDGNDSNAHLAKLLKLPVILVIDTIGMTRGIAPLLLGYQNFDPEVEIAGVILNKVGGERHEAKLRAAVTTYTNIRVIGAIRRDPALDVGERHLGLTTPAETMELDKIIAGLGRVVGEAVDIEMLLDIAATAPQIPAAKTKPKAQNGLGLKIGIIRDTAFGFYYPDDLESFTDAGARLVEINSLSDQHLPDLDGLFIGGGFPEIQMEQLAANKTLRAEIKSAIEAGLPTYAECGGMMYLCQRLKWRGDSYPMVGVIAATALMHSRPRGRGYTSFQALPAHPWGQWQGETKAHEFYYASMENLSSDTVFAHRIIRGHGIDGHSDAIVVNNLIAGFCHMRNTAANPWITRFLDFVRAKKTARIKLAIV